MNDKHVCSICGKEFNGFGNNAEPVNDGICCDKCNSDIVIPRRMADLCNKKPVDVRKKVKSFLSDFYKVKFDMLLKMKLQDIDCLDNTPKEFVGKILDETSCKMRDIAKLKLDEEVIRGILTDYVDIVGDDLGMVFALYEIVYGMKIEFADVDLNTLFN